MTIDQGDIDFPLSVDDDDDDDDSNEAERAEDAANKEDQAVSLSGSISAGEEGSDKEEPVTSGLSPLSDESKSQISPLSDVPSSRDSPSQSEPAQDDNQRPMSNGDNAGSEEPVDSSNHISDTLENTSEVTEDPANVTPVEATEEGSPACVTHMTNGTSPPPSPRTTRSQKRKREGMMIGTSRKTKHAIIYDSR